MSKNRHDAAREVIAANDNVNTLHQAGRSVNRTDLDRLRDSHKTYDQLTADERSK